MARGRAVFDALRRPDSGESSAENHESVEASPAVEPSEAEPDAQKHEPRAAPPDPDTTFPGEHAGAAVEPAEVAADAVLSDEAEEVPRAGEARPEPEQPIPGPRPIQGGEVARSLAGPGRPVGAHRDFPRVLAIANQKGGVGKTTTAVNLGASLAERGHRVLVVDLDPQGNATTGLGINARTLERSIYDVLLHDVPIDDCIEPTSLRNLFAVPATIELAGAEIELVPTFSRELKLRKALEAVGDDFDFTVIDCPPSLGLLTVNALAAAGEVVVPIQCEYYALEGLGQLLRNVHLVQGNLNPDLEVSAIILTMHDARTRLSDQVVNEVREHFGDRVCRTVVPRTVRLSEAPSFGQPVIVFDSTSRGALAYRELAKEIAGDAVPRTGSEGSQS